MQARVSAFLYERVRSAVAAGAPSVIVDVIERGPMLEAFVADSGPGLDGVSRDRAKRELSSLEESVRQAGGTFEFASEPDSGTSVRFTFVQGCAEATPLRDRARAIVSLLALAAGAGAVLRIRRERDGRAVAVASDELEEAFGPLGGADAQALAQGYVEKQEAALGNGPGA
jgi:hypothetical protein